jgi:hypothetical protein
LGEKTNRIPRRGVRADYPAHSNFDVQAFNHLDKGEAFNADKDVQPPRDR